LIRVTLLEPDYWRRRGIEEVVGESPEIEVVEDCADVVLLSQRVFAERGPSEIIRQSAQVIVYGEEDSAETAVQAFLAGARGYYAMSSGPSALCQAIEIVHNGGIWGPSDALVLLAKRPLDDDELEPQQLAVLRYLHEGLTNKEIGQRLGLAEATIKARMNRLYRRFGVTSRLQLLSAAIRRGIVEAGRDS
jgi:DNA-binding NarL/FixJ family response regulator